MPGTSDLAIIKYSDEIEGFILTEDKDFGEEIIYKKVKNNGALLLRLAGVPIEEKINLVITTIQKHRADLIGCFSVLNKNKLRVRKSVQ